MKTIVALAALLAVVSSGTIEPSLKIKLMKEKTADINVVLQPIDEIYHRAAKSISDTETRITSMITEAQIKTANAQAPYIATILAKGVAEENIQHFWISNEFFVKNADIETVEALLGVEGDFHIREPIKVHLEESTTDDSNATIKQGVQWGVQTINAPTAWQRTRGEGAVVATIGTGAYREHSALSSNYAGAWFDPYYGNPTPNDENGYGFGTHALGIIVGSENGIGVAPGAKWIACRGLNHQGTGYNAELLSCGQWILTANPRPHVVSNSWVSGFGDTFFNSVISAWRAARIVPVFPIGNTGSSCGSANSPGDQIGVLSVGATLLGDFVDSYSSRGPGASNSVKPEVSAPGSNIISAGVGTADSYTVKSGTSMAAAHVAGAAALVKSIEPDMSVEEVISRLQTTAAHPPVSNADRNCGNLESEWPNMAFGYGRIDAAAALPEIRVL